MRLYRSDLEVEVLVARINRGELDLQPDYQRGEVWDRARQQRLIDTILRDWYVPAIHIVQDQDLQQDLVLDGQQRLRTINRFMHDKLAVAGKTEPLRGDLEALDHLRYSELPPDIQRRVRRFQITVVTLTEYEPAEPAELFFRLNQQYALTPSEKRNALVGHARDQIRQLVKQLEANGLSKDLVGFSNGRLAYDDIIARVCLAIETKTLRRQFSNADLEQFYRQRQFSESTRERAWESSLSLLHALQLSQGVRFNKATLFSWLVFAYALLREGRPAITPQFLQEFEFLRARSEHRPASLDYFFEAYADRASYRVSDVSSVLIRDLAITAVYHQLEGTIPGRESVAELLNGRPVEYDLIAFLDKHDWGQLP